MKKKPSISVDPELHRQLDAAEKDKSVRAVFTLRTPEDNPLLEADVVQQTVKRIVETAKKTSGQDVHDLHVMPRAQAFSVAASPECVRSMLESPDIASAMASGQPEQLLIEPVPRPSRKAGPRDPRSSTKGKS